MRNQDNSKMLNRKSISADEFYTQYKDIAAEMINYKQYFYDKVIYCNCDHYKKSQFYAYFKDNFHEFHLKKLICTNYSGENCLFFDEKEPSYCVIYDGIVENIQELEENGSYNSKECLKILDSADIICTNPPFSLLKDFIPTISHKKFIILGNVNCIYYSKILPMLISGVLSHGFTVYGSQIKFISPYDIDSVWADHKIIDGKNLIRPNLVTWLSNFSLNNHRPLPLTKSYSKELYQIYDNYPDIINVDSIFDIPIDYKGLIGVPINFWDRWDKNEFSITDCISPILNNKHIFKRLVIKRK